MHVHGISALLSVIVPVELEKVKRGKAPTLKLFKSAAVHRGPVRDNPPTIVITAPVQSRETQGPPLKPTTFGMAAYGPLLIGEIAAITAPELDTVRLTCAGICEGALIVTEGAEA